MFMPDTKLLMLVLNLYITFMLLLLWIAFFHNLSSCSEIRPDIDPQAFNLESFLPSADDLCELKSNFQVHIARVITAFLPCLKPMMCAVSSHIQHRYSTEMSKKTVVVRENKQYLLHIQALQELYLYIQVPLGVQLKNENIIEEMVHIMSHIQEYVPTISSMVEIEVTGESTNTTTTVYVKSDHFHNILFGGDQLTVVRAHGAQHARENSVDGIGRLDGLVPVCEHCHARVCLLSVSEYILEQMILKLLSF